MARKGGFGGGMPNNMGNLMKQAQKMQKQMEEKSKQLENTTWETTAGGGAVKVVINGKKEIVSIEIKEEVVDPEDIEMLQDLILAATNEALRIVETESASAMETITGGISGFGGFPF